MTDIQHIDVDDEQFEDAPRALRDYAKKLKQQLDQVAGERDAFRNQVSESALGDVLAGFKNPGRVKSDLLSDGVDPLNTEAVNKWLADNGDDYAKGQGQAPPEGGQQEQQQVEVPDYGRLNGLNQIGTPSGADLADVVANPPAEIAGDPAALRKWFISKGI